MPTAKISLESIEFYALRADNISLENLVDKLKAEKFTGNLTVHFTQGNAAIAEARKKIPPEKKIDSP